MYKLTIAFLLATSAVAIQAEYFGHFDHHEEQSGEHFDHLNYHSGDGFDHHQILEHKEDEHPKDYNYDYAVHDPHSESYHSHQESSKDGVVKGYYSLKEADGSLREVHYTADKENGFKAIVTKNGEQVHPHTEGSSHQSGGWN